MSIHFVTKAAALATAVGAVAVLSGCAHPQLVEMGQTQEDVIAYLGEPQAKTPMPDGTVRFTYSVQPFGQQVWWLFIDQSGRVVSREQGLQEKYFKMLTPGKSTEADVWALWGSVLRSMNLPWWTSTPGCIVSKTTVVLIWLFGRSLIKAV